MLIGLVESASVETSHIEVLMNLALKVLILVIVQGSKFKEPSIDYRSLKPDCLTSLFQRLFQNSKYCFH